MVNKEEAIAEREEMRCKDKQATAKSFVDLQERSVTANKAIAKARLLEAEVKIEALEAEAKARLLEAEAKTKLLEAKTKLMTEKNNIMFTELKSISDPGRREWFEKRQKMIREHEA
jgi:hypothetical protein